MSIHHASPADGTDERGFGRVRRPVRLPQPGPHPGADLLAFATTPRRAPVERAHRTYRS